jgi:hypothetical protein
MGLNHVFTQIQHIANLSYSVLNQGIRGTGGCQNRHSLLGETTFSPKPPSSRGNSSQQQRLGTKETLYSPLAFGIKIKRGSRHLTG